MLSEKIGQPGGGAFRQGDFRVRGFYSFQSLFGQITDHKRASCEGLVPMFIDLIVYRALQEWF
jgi:hypothetical protein